MIKLNTQGISFLIILVLIVILILQRSCSPNPPPGEPQIETVIDTAWFKKDTIIYRDKLVPYKVIDSIRVPVDVDTAAILKDYFAKYIYKDSIPIDTFGYVRITDIITQNKIEKRQYSLDYDIPTITITNTITLPPEMKNQVYIGPEFMAPQVYLGGNIVLKTKKDQMYNIGAGITPLGPQFKVGMAWKIKLK